MAITERYVTAAATGGGDGTSGSPWTIYEGFDNLSGGYRLNIKDDSDYILTSNLTFTNAGTATSPSHVRGYSDNIEDGGRINISGGDYGFLLDTEYHYFENLNITTSGSPNTLSGESSAGYLQFNKCSFVHTDGSTTLQFNFADKSVILNNCYIEANTGRPIFSDSFLILNCCTTKNIGYEYFGHVEVKRGMAAYNCVFDASGNYRIIDLDRLGVFSKCTFLNGADGLYHAFGYWLSVTDCIFYNMGGDGINLSGNTNEPSKCFISNNAMGAITGNRVDGFNDNEELNPIVLTEDPFVDSINKDYTLNNASGGGALCKGSGLNPPSS